MKRSDIGPRASGVKIFTTSKKGTPQTSSRYTPEQVAVALRKAGGLRSEAASILRVTGAAITGYVKRWPQLRDVITDAKQEAIDAAESQLMKKIKEGNLTAIIFFLKTQAKHRGYVEKQETSGDVTVRVVYG